MYCVFIGCLVMAVLAKAQDYRYSTSTGLNTQQPQQNYERSQHVQQEHTLADPAIVNDYIRSYKETYGELNIGRDFFEGDIILTKQQSDFITRSMTNTNLEARAIVKDARKLWPNREVPYIISDNLSYDSKNYVKSAVEEWKNRTCVNLRPKKDTDDDYIEFLYDGGCSSYVGKVGGKQTISVGSDDGSIECKHGNIVHELAHSLGYFHEHSRPDRDDYIKVVWDNIMSGYAKNFRKETVSTVDSRGVPYDYDSVMHYGAFFFTNSDGDKTIETKKEGVFIGQRKALSDLDVKQARILYNCDGDFDEPRSNTEYYDTMKRNYVKKDKHEPKGATKKSSNSADKSTEKKSTHKASHLQKAVKHFIKKENIKHQKRKNKKAFAKAKIASVKKNIMEGTNSQETMMSSNEQAMLPSITNTLQDTVSANTQQAVQSQNGQQAVQSQNGQQTVQLQNTQQTAQSQNTQQTTGPENTQQAMETANTQQAVQSQNTQQAVQSSNTQQAMETANTQQAVQSQNTQQAVQSSNTQQAMETANTQQAVQSQNTQQAVQSSNTQQAMEAVNTLQGKQTSSEGAGPELIAPDDDLGEENLGMDYFEGDMIMTDEQRQYLEDLKDDQNGAAKRALIKNTTFLWPDRMVYYTFDGSVDKIGRENAENAIKHWQEKTCLKFQKRNDEKDYINFVFEGGCASRVGRGGGMQKLTIGSTKLRCKTGNIIHELGHALGFFHEHSRPDRDEYVKIVNKNIMPGYERNFWKFSSRFIDSRNVPYDYGSIMQYGRAFFSKLSLLLPTMITKKKTADGNEVEIGQREALSDMDILQANLLYGCDGRKKLTDEQREELEEDYSDPMRVNQGPCGDNYDDKACSTIKSLGYCEKYPRTLRRACGNTCQLCSTQQRHNFEPQGRKSIITRLRLEEPNDENPSKRRTIMHGQQ